MPRSVRLRPEPAAGGRKSKDRSRSIHKEQPTPGGTPIGPPARPPRFQVAVAQHSRPSPARALKPSPIRAERHSDADLARPRRDRERHHTVQTHRGKRHCQKPEQSRQSRHQTVERGRSIRVELLRLSSSRRGPEDSDRAVRTSRHQRRDHRRSCSRPRARAAVNGRTSAGTEGEVNAGQCVFAKRLALHVLHYADNLAIVTAPDATCLPIALSAGQ